METFCQDMIVEWIPYSNLQNIKYLTRGGCSEIYTADWIGGHYWGWGSNEQQLIRYVTVRIILKTLENAESASRSWFDELDTNIYKEIIISQIMHKLEKLEIFVWC
ncbi:hypothetical protein C1645_808467 [Glomus cerebriforme]|uniref:Uncharacterized protein n=1 Tax=Glomus cerebriforme TaxID=658196 RepID=A0A397SFM5_9GLOM|nr:hypothetical protein C1645_808467 [Glomus cerebriforme]